MGADIDATGELFDLVGQTLTPPVINTQELSAVLLDGVDAEVTLGSWPVPPLFALVRDLLPGMDARELHRTLNMGVGMVIVCAEADADGIRSAIDEGTWVIGRLVEGQAGHREVHLR